MNDSIKRICLDIHDSSSRETVNVKRGDTGRAIHIALADGGMPYRISEDCYAVFNGKKPDDTVVLNPCTIENNVIIYRLTAQTVAAEGLVRCEVTLHGAEGKVITSSRFNLMVDHKVYNENDKISSSDEFNVLEDLLEDVQDALEGADSAINIAVQASAAAAGYVIEEASGETIVLTEAENMPLAGLRICGKTTQDGVPTPEAPVALETAGSAGSVEARITGKNIIPYPYKDSSKTVAGVTFTVNIDGSIAVSGTLTGAANFWLTGYTFKLRKGVTYTLSLGSDYTFTGEPFFWISGPNSNIVIGINMAKQRTATFTPTKDVENAAVYMIASTVGSSLNGTIHPQLEVGTAATEYGTYMGKALTIATPNGLHGIPVSSGGNYTDENGQRWVCDEIDFVSGEIIRRTDRFVFDASLAYRQVSAISASGEPVYCYVTPAGLSAIQEFAYKLDDKQVLICSHGKYLGTNQNSSTPAEVGDVFGFNDPANKAVAWLGIVTTHTTIEEFKSWLGSQAAAETPVSVVFGRYENAVTSLSETDMAAYKALRTYKNYCVVSNDGPAYMELAYLMNAKKYLAKLAENGGLAVGSTVRVAEVTLSAAKWTGTESPYSQVVRITGVTSYSQVDLKPSVEQMAIFHEKDLAFVTENDEGVVTVYAIGQKPTNDYTMQVSITEVSV